MTNLNSIDNKMRLMAGRPIYVNDIEIAPLRLSRVVEIGYINIVKSLQILTLKVDDIIDSVDDFEFQAMLKMNKHQYVPYDLLMMSEGLQELVVEGLEIILDCGKVYVEDKDTDNPVIVVNTVNEVFYEINRENFDEIVKVLKEQNNPSISSEEKDEDYNPSDELAKSIAEKLKRGKEIANKSKSIESGGDGVTILDIISAVTAMSNSVNKLNIWDYTIYQLYDEFARLNKIDNYKLQVQASMWSSEIEIEHWSEPL